MPWPGSYGCFPPGVARSLRFGPRPVLAPVHLCRLPPQNPACGFPAPGSPVSRQLHRFVQKPRLRQVEPRLSLPCFPRQAPSSLAPPLQDRPPLPSHFPSHPLELGQRVPEREVLVVPSQLLDEHALLLARVVVSVRPQPLLDAAQILPHALGPRHADHGHAALPVRSQVVSEAKQVKVVRVVLAGSPVPPAEGDQRSLLLRQ